MFTRHNSRELALQTLFYLDFRNKINNAEKSEEFYSNVLEMVYENKPKDDFSFKIFSGIIKNLEAINDIIIKTTPDWGIDKTAIVDRNILRIAIYEMVFDEDKKTPPRVAINEAIELSKTFGHKQSFKFISGVLGAIYEISGLKEKDNDKTKAKKIVEKNKIGALPYKIEDGKVKILLIENIFDKWTLPKGDVSSENKNEALKNVLKKKLNIDGQVKEFIGENDYKINSADKDLIKKHISYFLFEVSNIEEVSVENAKGAKSFEWFDFSEIESLRKYNDMSDILKTGIDILLKIK